MGELVVTTYDWVPEAPRGHVRDLRVCWALEEAGLPYRMAFVSRAAKDADFLAHQPFGQVPWLTDGDLSIFESGAILLHLAERSETLMPRDAEGRAATIQWMFAALNSVEMAVLPWSLFKFARDASHSPGRAQLDEFLTLRLDRMEAVLADREWLAGRFTAADILMADVLRLVDRFEGLTGHPATKSYVDRAKARPAFRKALADQLAHFAAADEGRA